MTNGIATRRNRRSSAVAGKQRAEDRERHTKGQIGNQGLARVGPYGRAAGRALGYVVCPRWGPVIATSVPFWGPSSSQLRWWLLAMFSTIALMVIDDFRACQVTR